MKIVSHINSEGVSYCDRKTSSGHCERARKNTRIIEEVENPTSEEDKAMA